MASIPETLIQIEKMMCMSDTVMIDYPVTERMLMSKDSVANRTYGIQQIKQDIIRTRLSPECRDTSIQIFDRYLTCRFQAEPVKMDYIPAISQCAFLLGAKICGRKAVLYSTSIENLDVEEMLNAECEVLSRIGFEVYPQATPSAFVSYLLNLWPADPLSTTRIHASAQALISGFSEDCSWNLFAPSTIAVSAILLAFVFHGLSYQTWLNNVPNYCLPSVEESSVDGVVFFSHLPVDSRRRVMDVDNCMELLNGYMHLIPAHRHGAHRYSPTSVAESSMDD